MKLTIKHLENITSNIFRLSENERSLIQEIGLKIGYVGNVYGWRFDVFVVADVIVTIGYQSTKNAKLPTSKQLEILANLAKNENLNNGELMLAVAEVLKSK